MERGGVVEAPSGTGGGAMSGTWLVVATTTAGGGAEADVAGVAVSALVVALGEPDEHAVASAVEMKASASVRAGRSRLGMLVKGLS